MFPLFPRCEQLGKMHCIWTIHAVTPEMQLTFSRWLNNKLIEYPLHLYKNIKGSHRFLSLDEVVLITKLPNARLIWIHI